MSEEIKVKPQTEIACEKRYHPKPINLENIIKDFTAIERNKFKDGKDDNESLSTLIDTELSQSEKIQFGSKMEKMLTMFILRNTLLKNIKEKNCKGKKETDHLFLDSNQKIVYYAELKSNLNLDTEKCIGTVEKCLKIERELKNKYDGYKICMFLVGLRHLNKSTIRHEIANKYELIHDNLVGLNEYILALGISQQSEFECEDAYKIFINKFVNMLKQHN
jgi:hypothetical protein